MKASARHLLVQSEKECQEIKDNISEGKITFEEAAKKQGDSGTNLATTKKTCCLCCCHPNVVLRWNSPGGVE